MSRKVVLDMKDQRPVWAMPDWAVGEIRAALEEDWVLHVVEAPADGSGDGTAGPSPEALEAVEAAAVYLGFGIPAAILRVGRELEWVHSGAAGVGSSLTPEMRRWEGIFTNSAGIHGPPMAETALGMILHFARGLDFAVRGQARGEWRKEPFYRADSPVREVAGSTVGVLGYGGVGSEVGRRAAALGARVLGLKRTPPEDPAPVGEGKAGEVELVWGREGLDRIRGESDYLVVTAPETDETLGLVDDLFIGGMKEGAVLVNLARGSLVDEDALAAALRSGRLRGAALDVFRQEPLPRESPLWDLSNVLVTPHVSGVSRRYWRRETDLIKENLRRFSAGEALLNVVDPAAGY